MEKSSKIILVVFIIILVIFLLVNLGVWYSVQHCNFDKVIQPGDTYKIGERSYKVPDVPLVGTAYLLKESYLQKQRDLLINIAKMMKENNLEYWISGGTLLGFTRHKTFIPWDDDIDIHTHWSNREFLFSDEFIDMVNKYGMEIIILFNSNLQSASKEGAAIRLRFQNTTMPVCDIFFVKAMDETNTKYAKVDSWSKDNIVFSTKEIWNQEYLFPTQLMMIDDMELRVPNQPVDTLQCQYGKNALTKMYARSPWISHHYAYKVLSWVWHVKRKQNAGKSV